MKHVVCYSQKFSHILALYEEAGKFHFPGPEMRSVERKANRLIQKLSKADRAELESIWMCVAIDRSILENAF